MNTGSMTLFVRFNCQTQEYTIMRISKQSLKQNPFYVGSLAVLMNTQNPDVAYWPHFLFQKVVKFYDFICSNVSHCVLYCI